MDPELDRAGRVWLRDLVPSDALARLAAALPETSGPGARIAPDTQAWAMVRDGLWSDAVAALLPGARPVRVLSFSKDAGTNWGVPWHQDRVITVATRDDRAPVAKWSRKGSAWHCEPPVDVLGRMLLVRIHLDANHPENGAMQIARGSHRRGLVPAGEAQAVAEAHEIETCSAAPGDVLVLPMLTLHRSGAATDPAPRGALRIDYAAGDPPAPLRWLDAARVG